jgi:hypothetical protein
MRQRQALSVMLGGNSVFLTGPPGAGKTYVLNEFVRRAERAGKKVAVTASTGIAATHIGGTTIHSWSGLGIRDQLNDYDKQWLQSNDRLRKRYLATDVLVIDEVSMLHGARLDMVNEACKLLREDNAPFGGLQMVLVGDLFQLPPVSRGSELVDFAHTSGAWEELAPKICYLTEQHRQQNDGLLSLLQAMRDGQVDEWQAVGLHERLQQTPPDGQPVTRLFAHNADVETINQTHLTAIKTESKMYTMRTKGAAAKIEQLSKSVLAPEQLELKEGAEVMFVANNFASGFVNGTRGKVARFSDGMPVVELATSGREVKVEQHSWSLQEDGKVRAEVTQLPLRLAWAITIHKSQGMSLDAAEIDLSRSFTPGMGYVALSRVRSLEGIYLKGLNNMALAMHPDIYEFDASLRQASEVLASDVEDLADEASAEASEASGEEATRPEINQELFEKLRAWRLDRARRDQVAPFIIAHNSMLEELAARPPASQQQLLATKGFGAKKCESYGEDILAITTEYAPSVEEPASASASDTANTTTGASEAISLAAKGLAEESQVAQAGAASYRDKVLATYPRAYSRWQPEEDAQLLALASDQQSLQAVCSDLERQPSAVWARLLMLTEKSSVPESEI